MTLEEAKLEEMKAYLHDLREAIAAEGGIFSKYTYEDGRTEQAFPPDVLRGMVGSIERPSEIPLSGMKSILETIGLPVAYHHFAEGDAPTLPFVIFYIDEHEYLPADGSNYYGWSGMVVEYYTEYKSPDYEAVLEVLLEWLGVIWRKSEIWIQTEKMFEIRYEFSI